MIVIRARYLLRCMSLVLAQRVVPCGVPIRQQLEAKGDMPRSLRACRSDENDRDMPLPRLVGHRGRGGSTTRFVRAELGGNIRPAGPPPCKQSLELGPGRTSMTELTRRTILTGAVATGAATALIPLTSHVPAHAAASAAGEQAPGFYRYKIGSFECTSINDGARSFTMPDTFVRNVPKAEALAAAEAAYMPKGMVTVPFNPQVINTGSKIVLIDTGNGPIPNAPVGKLVPNMMAAGIDPKSVDIVIISHLHPDHANGIRTADGGLAFPNAEIKVPAQDWAFWMSD